MELKIEYLPIFELRTYANNAKVHTAEQIEEIKASIEQFGFNDPIAVWRDNEIIEGHGRLVAAIELGLDEVPVIRLDKLTDEERRAYGLIHNKLTMNTGFSFDVLNDELEKLGDMPMDIFGFKKPEEVSDDGEEEESEDVAEPAAEAKPDVRKIICPRCGKVVEARRIKR